MDAGNGGGSADFMHADVKKARGIGRGFTSKTAVMGLLAHADEKRASRVTAKVIKNTQKATLKREIDASVQTGSMLHTDAWIAYQSLGADYTHMFVDHAVRYVQDNVHTNGLENFWCLLKRTLKGTYVHVNAAQLQAYLDEQAWRYNERKLNGDERFAAIAKAVCGKRLTYKQLVSLSRPVSLAHGALDFAMLFLPLLLCENGKFRDGEDCSHRSVEAFKRGVTT